MKTDDSVLLLEWTFSPPDFFGTMTSIAIEDGTVSIADGAARGEFPGHHYDEGHAFADRVRELLRVKFQMRQLENRRSFTFSANSALQRRYSDGRRAVTAPVGKPLVVKPRVGRAKVVIVKDGKVLYDSEAERLRIIETLEERAVSLSQADPLVRQLLNSYSGAVENSEKSLVYLYEIREALCSHFGGERSCKSALGPFPEWSDFGKLCNDEPVLEGRHSGANSSLREMTRDERRFAFAFGKKLISSYVDFKSP